MIEWSELNGPRKLVRKCIAAAPRQMRATSRKERGRARPIVVVGDKKEGRERGEEEEEEEEEGIAALGDE